MSFINQGNQSITFDYKHPAQAKRFDTLFRDLLKPGIYQGGLLSDAGSSIVSIAPFVAVINVDTDKSIRIKTTLSVSIIPTIAEPIIYMTYTWSDVIENWADFDVRSTGVTPVTNEVVFGRALFDDGGILTGFDYSERTRGLLNDTYGLQADSIDVRDNLVVGGTTDFNGEVDVNDYKIVHLGDPSEAHHAVNRGYSDARYLRRGVIDSIVNPLINRVTAEEQKNSEQELRISYLEGRQQNGSDSFVELYLNESNYPNFEDGSNKPAELMDDNDFNNNWKYREAGRPDFKNGFVRQQKQPFMLEVIDQYNLDGVAQALIGSISRYDSINDCYWMMSCAAANGIGEITRLSKDMKDGRVQVLGRWYLAAKGATTYWTGIDVKTDGTYLFISLLGNPTTTASWIGKIKITNTSGVFTLGESNCPNGATIYADIVISSTTNGSTTLTLATTVGLRTGMLISGTGTVAGTYIASITDSTTILASASVANNGAQNLTYTDAVARLLENNANNIITDVTVWDSTGTNIGFIQTTAAAGAARAFRITFRKQTGDASWPSLLAASTLTNITMQPAIINGNEALGRSLLKDVVSNVLWTKLSCATAALGRFIWKINLTTDVLSNILVKTSGRFACARSVADTGNGGITISAYGDILELCSTAANGKFFAKRAYKHALWAENQIDFEYRMNAATNTNVPWACMIHNNCIYTADTAATAQQVDLYRFDILTGAKHSIRLAGATSLWTSVYDMTTDGTNAYIIGSDGTNCEVAIVPLTTLNTKLELVADYDAANTVNIDTDAGWAMAAGVGVASTDKLQGICYDSDAGVLLLINDTDDKIDSLSLDGATWTQAVYDLPAPTSVWSGIAYKDSKIYVSDYTATTTPGRTFVLDKTLSTDTAMYRLHIYQDPSPTFTNVGKRCFDFYGNSIVALNSVNLIFYGHKTIEDNDVMQLHTFMDSNNILLTSLISCVTPVIERYFEPYEFSDPKNVPDKFYCGIGYGDEGFSILHLDEFLNNVTATGKDRYDIRKIRVWHFIEGAATIIYDATGTTSCIDIEKEIIYVGDIAGYVKIVDLKSGTSTILYTGTSSGFQFQGTLSQRNEAMGYTGSLNAELNISNAAQRKIHAKTFTKDDQSDYALNNPKTFVLIGTDGVCDLLIIDWDANNNRVPVKVWNNLLNDASYGQYACYIAPSGTVFVIDNIITTGPTSKSIVPVWEINAEGATSATLFTAIGTNLLASAGYDISRTSRCWKTSTGTWRHQLLVTSSDLAAGTFVIKTAIIDVENATIEVLFSNASSTTPTGTMMADESEDIIFSHHVYSTTRAEMNVFKKLRFNDLKSTETTNNWSTYKTNGVIDLNSRPNFIPILAVTALLVTETKYSRNFNVLALSGGFGLQLFHFPNINLNILVSKEITLTQNPSQIVYNTNQITPYSGITGE